MTTLQTMLTLLRQRTNMENNQFVTDAELTSYLNNSLCLLDGLLISKFNDYKITSVDLTTTTDTLALPAGFLKMRGLDVIVGDQTYTVQPFSFKQRNNKSRQANIGQPYSIEYRLQGTGIKLTPADTAPNYTYTLWYTPDYIPLVNTTDSLPAYMDSQAWYEYAIVDSAIKVLAKQDLDPSVFIQQAAELKDHILKLSAPNRNAGDPISIVDSRGYDRSGGYGWNW